MGTSLLPSAIALGLAALAAAALARPPLRPDPTLRRRAARALGVALLAQALHFAEETVTGFPVRFPALFGLPPLSLPLFVGFNVAWLGIWAAALPGLRAGFGLARFAAWFLAIAGVANGLGHPAFALAVGGYFPGLVSSPAIAAAAAGLALRLRAARAPAGVG